jgi:methylthioribose-1-phosphate isomerase
MPISTIQWTGRSLKIIDQRRLPGKFVFLHCYRVQEVWQAIKTLSVRGAPALGVAAAYGVVLGLKNLHSSSRGKIEQQIEHLCVYLGSSRPTAVNLFHALDAMKQVVKQHPHCSVQALKHLLKKKADEIYDNDRRVCRKIGRVGSRLIKKNHRVMTLCNAGALATADYGTALGVLYAAHKKTKFKVYACETRPLMQGARLTTWELLRHKIDVTLICDSMAADLMRQGLIDLVIVGADRIAGNGDVANKIGTYNLAVLAKYHRVPFYVVAPKSTFDHRIMTGREIPIEHRSSQEIKRFCDVWIAPKNVKVYNPAFDITPCKFISGIITEKGILVAPFRKRILKFCAP